MLTAKVYCTVCKRQLAKQSYPTYRELAFGAQTMLVGCHAAMPHCNHKLDLQIEGDGFGPDLDTNELHIKCQAPACRHNRKEWKVTVPIELVGAMVLIFHTGHEGHPLEVYYKGHRWQTMPA